MTTERKLNHTDLAAIFADGEFISHAGVNANVTYLYPPNPETTDHEPVAACIHGNLLAVALITQDEDTVLRLLDQRAEPKSWLYEQEGAYGWDSFDVFPIELALKRNMPRVAKRLLDMGVVDFRVYRQNDSDEGAGHYWSEQTLGEQIFAHPEAVEFLASLGVVSPAISWLTPYRFKRAGGNSIFSRARRKALQDYAFYHFMADDAFTMRKQYMDKVAAQLGLDFDKPPKLRTWPREAKKVQWAPLSDDVPF